MRGVGLERRGLWREYLRALREADPLVFVMENVPQLLRSGEYADFRGALFEQARDLGPLVAQSSDFSLEKRARANDALRL